MSETPSEPETRPIEPVATPAAPGVVDSERDRHTRRPSRLNTVAAWVGIVAGSVFIVGAVFFSGFFIGLVAGHGGQGYHHGGGDRDRGGMMHHEGPGSMFRPGPGMFPGGPGGFPGGPGGPGNQGGQQSSTAPTPPTR